LERRPDHRVGPSSIEIARRIGRPNSAIDYAARILACSGAYHDGILTRYSASAAGARL